jgi:hypothetical protein
MAEEEEEEVVIHKSPMAITILDFNTHNSKFMVNIICILRRFMT